MKNKGGYINYKDRDYKLEFNLNVMEIIQDEYGTIEKWGELTDGGETGEPNVKALIFGLTEMLNEGIEIDNENNNTDIALFTTKQVGRMISEIGIDKVADEIGKSVTASVDDDEKNE